MKFLITVTFLVFINAAYSQTGYAPYPVVFVHGLNSDNTTWNTIITQLGNSWNISSTNVLSFVNNARGGDTTHYLQDVIIPQKDLSGNFVNQLTISSVYAMNFGNFWNRNPDDPRIILYDNATPGSNQSPGNQSSIYKQGYALKIMIDSILRITGAEKVILLGHSMGGLAIREYLQRKENGVRKWWVNPDDTVNGHKVAKVISIGTPHLGTNVTSIPFFTIDNNSEAMRDMKISFSSGQNGAYLFGNIETNVPSSFYNADVNCNGIVTDTIAGIDNLTYDNPVLSLPQNVLYTWITSNYLGLGTDLAVPFNNQRLYLNSNPAPPGIADTIRTNRNHIQETNDNRSLIRGLDEPDKLLFAYDISFDKQYSGFITLKSNSVTSDSDFYKLKALNAGKLKLNINSSGAGVNSIALLSESGNILASKALSGISDSLEYTGESGIYFYRVTGNSSNNPSQNSYRFSAGFIASPALNLTLSIQGMWNGLNHVRDSIKIILRYAASPFNKSDSALVVIDSSGNAETQFTHLQNGNYFIQILHRNALETWSSAAVNFESGNLTLYDFTSAQSAAYGGNQIFKIGKWCFYSGDVNSDGVIDGSDAVLIGNDAEGFVTGYTITDLTGDEVVDAEDAAIADNNAANFISKITP